jgi:hypothetical protein
MYCSPYRRARRTTIPCSDNQNSAPDYNPIEGAFSKIKTLLRKAKARTQEALFEATHQALGAVTAEDARGFFGHCGYTSPQAQSM